MIILSTGLDQGFSIIPKSGSDTYTILMSFENQTTKDIYVRFADVNLTNDLCILSNDNLDFLKENDFYNLKVYFGETNEIIYKDIVFCTNQTNYTINESSYVLPTINNNSYITI